MITGATGFSYRGEAIITSILAYTLKTLGGKLEPRRKLSIQKAWVDGIPVTDPIRVGDILTVTVKSERLPHAKKADLESPDRRTFMALVNYATDQVMIEEISPTEETVELDFKLVLRERGKNSFRVYVFTGDGKLDGSFNRDVYAV